MNSVTALIKTFLRDEYVFRCVESLRQFYPAVQILVADDGHHTDEKEEKLSRLGVQYIKLPFGSAPICKARNLLVDAAQTPYVLIGDDDFYYTPVSRLHELVSMMEIADIAGGAIVENSLIKHYEGHFDRQNGVVLKPLQVKDYLRLAPLPRGVEYAPVDYCWNFFVARRDALLKARWDERLRASYEHEDFFLSAQDAGLKTVYCPNSSVLHRYGSPDSFDYQQHRHSGDFKDRKAFEAKWGGKLKWR